MATHPNGFKKPELEFRQHTLKTPMRPKQSLTPEGLPKTVLRTLNKALETITPRRCQECRDPFCVECDGERVILFSTGDGDYF
uniref:Uncharacterized protein n=1 Tax=Ascaris lumbricoides TaxID=6252 RepID=A0A0M3HWU6_ASCLU